MMDDSQRLNEIVNALKKPMNEAMAKQSNKQMMNALLFPSPACVGRTEMTLRWRWNTLLQHCVPCDTHLKSHWLLLLQAYAKSALHSHFLTFKSGNRPECAVHPPTAT